MTPFSVVICGAGTAGIEGLLRLQRLGGSRLDVTLVSPAAEFVHRPMTVLEAFGEAPARRYSIQRIADDTGSRWVSDSLGWIDRAQQIVHTTGGTQLHYDALLLAMGGREQPPVEHFDVFNGRDGGAGFREVIAGVAAGRITNLAFVQPRGSSWILPLYELALLTAHRARGTGRTPQLAMVIPGARPLEALGGEAGAVMERLLSEAGIDLHANADPHLDGDGRLVVRPGGTVLAPDRTISLPTIVGPNIRGIPGFAADRFLHVDGFCRVLRTDGRIFAAGDATDLPVKHGGIGTQQADVAAAGIAHLAGEGPPPARLRPRIAATLFTGNDPLYLSAYLIDGRGWQARFYDEPPWNPEDKVFAEELGPYLRALDAPAPVTR